MLRRARGLPHFDAIGGFHVGGRPFRLSGMPVTQLSPVAGSASVSVDPNGTFLAGQMYVQYVRLQDPVSPIPLLLWHGGGLTGACWEETPDGRSGWQSLFLRLGYHVYVSDAVERGRAGWARSPEIFPGAPFFMPSHAAWNLYRIGSTSGYCEDPSRRTAHEGSLFPVDRYDQFCRQIVPRFHCNDEMIGAAYDAYLAGVGKGIVVAHSQGGGFALAAAARQPETVSALVLIEPAGAERLSADERDRIADIPLMVVWGDYIDEVEFWREARRATLDLVKRRPPRSATAFLDLPAEGCRGNSHLLMMDTNSDDIGLRIGDWLRQHAGLG